MAELNRHRYENTVRVLEALWRERSLSRADLARTLRLDRSTTGSLVDFLLGQGLVEERPSPTGASHKPQGGRPPLLVQLKADRVCVIGLDVGRERIRVIAVDPFGRPIVEHRISCRCSSDTLVSETIKAVRAIEGEVYGYEQHAELVALGIGISGIVDSDSGTIQFSRDLAVDEPIEIASRVSGELGVPVHVLNDADACALAEIEFGEERVEDLLFLLGHQRGESIRTGLGIVLDGNLRKSHSGVGREFRSPFVSASSQEQFAVSDSMRAGKLTAEAAFEEFTEELAVSISFLVHALDLRHIVLGGDLSEDSSRYAQLERCIRDHIRSDTVRTGEQPLLLRAATMGNRSVAYGACAGALRRLFETRRFPLSGRERESSGAGQVGNRTTKGVTRK